MSQGQGLAGRVFATGEPCCVDDYLESKLISRDWAYHLENRLRDAYAMQGVPLVIDFVPRKRRG